MASSFLQELVETRFSKFEGLKIAGTVPLQQDLVNEALGELVSGAGSKSGGIPVKELLPLVRKVQVRAEAGVIHVDFEIGV